MNAKDLREKTQPELQKALRDNREELLNLRLRKQTGQVEHSHQIRELRRDVARITTLLKERETLAEKA